MSKSSSPKTPSISGDDGLADERQAISEWIEGALASTAQFGYYRDVELKSLSAGEKLLSASPEQARRYVLAALAEARHWDAQTEQIRSQGATELQRINSHHLPGWQQAWARRRQAEAVIRTLMRRALPFQPQDLLDILQWCNGCRELTNYFAPIGLIVRALERFAANCPIDPELQEATKTFATRLRTSHDKDAKRSATKVEQLCPTASLTVDADAPSAPAQPPPQPAPAGLPGVLVELKRMAGMLPVDGDVPSTAMGPDQFPLADNSPLRPEHELLSDLFNEIVGTQYSSRPDLERFAAGRKLLQLELVAAGRALLAAAERHVHALTAASADYRETQVWQARYAAPSVVSYLLRGEFSLARSELFDLLLYLAARPTHERAGLDQLSLRLIALAEDAASESPLTEGERYVLSIFRDSLIAGPPLDAPSEDVQRLIDLIGDGARFCLVPGEVWTDMVNEDFSRMPALQRRQWSALFAHALTATSSRPSAKWLKTADKLIEDCGGDQVQELFSQWLPIVAQGQSRGKLGAYAGDTRGAANTMHEENATCLRGLLWLAQLLPRVDELTRVITAVALSAYKKVPGVGPRAVKVGNAAVYALSEMTSTEAVGQLAMLKVRVKFGTAQKEIEKAFNLAAEKLGLPRDQIEEMGVPSYGLEEVGKRIETLGEYTAELQVTGSDAQLQWFDAKRKQLKSVPAKVRQDHPEDLKDLQQSLKDIQGMLPAQRDRIDSMFLLQKSWPIQLWRERYLEHPLVGTIAGRLLWCVDGVPALFIDGVPTDIHGQTITHGNTAEITLWHPVGRTIDEITSWRQRLETLAITQPFKQAHRELYLLTDAERNTHSYSNRFAAHIIRQHQFNALCLARGWKNKLRLMVDDSYPPPTKDLPQWGLRAEFWVEGTGDNYGTDTNESGVYLRLATDQVRFYRAGAALNYAHAGGGGFETLAAGPGQGNINQPVSLDQIPPLVFSEVMRDVDLFVGVASVGNDPTWQDGGPEGRYREYWHNYSFGELSGNATTRKQVLERLVPRLKIADRCSFSDRFLIVRGKKRTYKIHLGSSNILMEPNDQYLCIVPDSRSRAKQDDLFLPFEGDTVLSIIISKALLLADDSKITDPTITRQIDRA